MDIQRELLGREIGLGQNGELIVNTKYGVQAVLGRVKTVTVSSAQLLALFATPQTIIPAPGAGLAIVPTRMVIYKPAGTAYAGIAGGEDLVLKYTSAAGAQCSGVMETTGFLDQTTNQTRYVFGQGSTGATPSDVAPVSNAIVVLHLLVGEITTGNSPIHVRVWYDIVNMVFTP